MTVDDIINEMNRRVVKNEVVTPASWLDSAQRLNILADMEVDREIAGMEACMVNAKVVLIKAGESAAKAEILCTENIDYQRYRELKARRETITEYIRLAKKRASLPRDIM